MFATSLELLEKAFDDKTTDKSWKGHKCVPETYRRNITGDDVLNLA